MSTLEPNSTQPPPAHRLTRVRRGIAVLARRPLAALSVAYLVVLAVCALLAPWFAPYDPHAQDVVNALQGPSGEHWLGTDTLGRDVLSRMLYGIAPTFGGAVEALLVFLVLGVPLGVLAGYLAGRTDAVVNRIAEFVLSIPPIIVVLVVLVVFEGSTTAAMLCLGLLSAPGLVRVVRAAAAAVREELFVTAARVSGVPAFTIMASHILRRVRGPILVQGSLFLGIALAFQAALAFLGLTSSGGTPTWGSIVGEAAGVIAQSSWLLIPPGLAITLAVLAFGFLGDLARDLSADGDEVLVRPRRDARRSRPASARDLVRAEVAGDALLQVDGLTVETTDGTSLITDVGFGVQPGETVGLVGESGCGKSVTALSVLGLLPTTLHLAAGSVVFDDVDLVEGGKRAYAAVRGSGIAYISQDPMAALDPTHTVGSHLDEVIALHERLDRAARRARAIELLEQVRIADPERVLGTYPHQISGGMAQRISIAIALAGRPRLLVADEPTTALDVTVQSEILALLRELRREVGLAILLITHDWGVVADTCDRVVVMYAGEIVETADAGRLFARPSHPYTSALLAADVSRDLDSPRLPTLPGRVPSPAARPVGCRFADRCELAVEACRAEPVPLIATAEDARSRCLRTDQLMGRQPAAAGAGRQLTHKELT
ncbi:dipeptide/oligopeptide/nickel ABC transporter permease/ATP-binding protein [Nocardioides sp. NPDC058538]|uniref:dipeptide/oligopeptide/nickel ABC transporter permease/ATP-binding protein n=1 Tax=Nocardioides sp. NPDC058538 TaxID=3346542 RepID=UPI00364603A5